MHLLGYPNWTTWVYIATGRLPKARPEPLKKTGVSTQRMSSFQLPVLVVCMADRPFLKHLKLTGSLHVSVCLPVSMCYLIEASSFVFFTGTNGHVSV